LTLIAQVYVYLPLRLKSSVKKSPLLIISKNEYLYFTVPLLVLVLGTLVLLMVLLFVFVQWVLLTSLLYMQVITYFRVI